MPEMRQQMRSHIERLAKADGVEGALLVSRDGIAVVELMGRPVNQEMFAAMSAMMMGAAETAVGELGEPSPVRLSIKTTAATVLIQGATEELLLVAIGGPALDPSVVEDPMNKAAEGIRALAG